MGHDHDHHHGHAHGHHHHVPEDIGGVRLVGGLGLNLLLTVIEVVAGILAGSLALIADALHNLSDAAALVVALAARRIARRRPDRRRTFGYRRANIIGAMVNLTALLLLSILLLVEAVRRAMEPQEVDGVVVAIVAGAALVVDVLTAFLLAAPSKGSLNIRAAFLHHVADALASLAVILGGVAIALWDLRLVDPLLTALIAGAIGVHALRALRETIAILMDSVPAATDLEALDRAVRGVEGVLALHHVHVRQLDEDFFVMEGHVVVAHDDARKWEEIKRSIKRRLEDDFHIRHATLELEFLRPDEDEGDERPFIAGGH